MLRRWPSPGGRSASMLLVRPRAMDAMASLESATGPPSPMFSPAEVHKTPAAVSRAPSPGSPGHWCDRPQVLAMTEVWPAALLSRPAVRVRGGGPRSARAWVMGAKALASGGPLAGLVDGGQVGEADRGGRGLVE